MKTSMLVTLLTEGFALLSVKFEFTHLAVKHAMHSIDVGSK